MVRDLGIWMLYSSWHCNLLFQMVFEAQIHMYQKQEISTKRHVTYHLTPSPLTSDDLLVCNMAFTSSIFVGRATVSLSLV